MFSHLELSLFSGRSRTKASFSHLALLLFEGGLARKLRFHILHFHFLREVSHEMHFFILLCEYWNGCVLEWVQQGSGFDLVLVIFLLKSLLKTASKSFFWALASRFGFGAAISDAGARSFVVFCSLCRSHCNGCVQAGHRKSYWNFCIKPAIVTCQHIFSILALVILLLKFLLENAYVFFFASASRSGLCKSFSV